MRFFKLSEYFDLNNSMDISGIVLYLIFACIQSYEFVTYDEYERELMRISNASDYFLTIAMFAGVFRALTALFNLHTNTRFVM